MRASITLGLLSLLLGRPAVAQQSSPSATYSIAPVAAPAVGMSAVDPSFGVTVRRLTERGAMGGLATAEYPQLQAVNADETRVLVSTETDQRVLDLGSLAFTHTGLDLTMPRWSPVEADVIYAFNRRSGGTIVFMRHELMGGGLVMSSDVVDVSALGYSSLELGSWEDLSSDGRYVALYGVRNGQNTAAILDLQAGQLRGTVAAGNVDWVAVSPSGAYLAVQYATRGTGPTDGLAIYDAQSGAFLGHAADHHEHGDLGVDAQGADTFMTIAYTDYCANGAVPCCTLTRLPDAIERNQLDNLYQLGAGTYSTCRNHRRPGFCVHADDYGMAGQTAFAQEIWLTRITDGAVLRLLHHRSSSCSYYNLSRPNVSPTGRYILFTSDWAAPNCSDQGDLYLIDTQPFLDAFLGAAPPPRDAGVVDTGPPQPPLDAGFDDRGQAADANTPPPPDAGPAPGEDAGLAAADAQPPAAADAGSFGPPQAEEARGTSGGCACEAASSADPAEALALALLSGIAARGRGARRRRSSPRS